MDDLREIIKGVNQIALLTTNYYEELKRLGMSDEQALVLATELQNSIMHRSMNNDT